MSLLTLKEKKKEHFWVWVFALNLTVCGYLEDFEMKMPGPWRAAGSREVWLKVIDIPAWGGSCWRIPDSPVWQGNKAALGTITPITPAKAIPVC